MPPIYAPRRRRPHAGAWPDTQTGSRDAVANRCPHWPIGCARRSSTRADIERLTTVLEQERTTRRQKEQYAALARRIHAYPSRSDTQAEIERLNSEIASLKKESDSVSNALELRSKRFAGFMHALHDMQTLLASEAPEATPMVE